MGSFLLNPYFYSGYAIGGERTIFENYNIHTFKTDGTFQVVTPYPIFVEYLIVAGGGGGGTDYYQDRSAGGGGAGGFISGSTILQGNQNYPIVVGTGGAGGFAGTLAEHGGFNGTNSSFNELVAVGGGGGAGHNTSSNTPGKSGGSGGGSTHDNTNGPAGTGIVGQGYNGGTAGNEQGGPGTLSSISGEAKYYAAGGSASSSGNYTGGGGGGSSGTGVNGELIGGSGIGGNSGLSTGVVQGTNAVANTGSGGGASRETQGGYGSDGIVIIRYQKIILDGSTAEKAAPSALFIKMNTETTQDGLYWIKNPNVNSGNPIQVYCDMNKDGGGWMLVLTVRGDAVGYMGWTDALVQQRNSSSPSMSEPYSIISWADYFKRTDQTWQWMIEASLTNSTERYQNGGIFSPTNSAYILNTTALQAGVTVNEWFPNPGAYYALSTDTGIGNYVPHRGGLAGYSLFTTDNNDSSWWGNIICVDSQYTSYKTGPWMDSTHGNCQTPLWKRVWIR